MATRTITRAPALTAALAALALGLVAGGQALAGRSVPAGLGWLAFLSGRLDGIFLSAESVAAASVLLACGAAVFAIVESRSETTEQEPATPGWLPWPADLSRRDAAVAATLAAAGLGLFLYTVVRLGTSDYTHTYAWLFFAALALLFAAFLWVDQGVHHPRVRLSLPIVAEAVFVAAVVGSFVALNVMDLDNWKYAAIGDEFDGYGYAKRLEGGDIPNPFSQRLGVERTRPVLGSVVDAAFLKAFGGDLFAWKLRLVVLAAASMVPFYLLARELFGWRVAVPALAFFASSHYVFGYTHHPTFIDALLPTTLSLWLLVVGLRRNSVLALFASGAAAGLGFYTFYAARAIGIVIALYVVSLGPRFLRPGVLAPLALGFLVLVAPMFASDGWYVFDRMLDASAAGYSEDVVGSRATRFVHNIALSGLAFNYNEDAQHYVSGSLLDPITAVLYVLGAGVILARVKHARFRFVAIWWLIAIAATGLTNPYPEVAISRLHYVVPAAALLAGLAFDRMVQLGSGFVRAPPVGPALSVAALAVVMAPVLYLNLHRFWYETPAEHGSSWEAVAVRAYFRDDCRDAPRGVTIVTEDPRPVLRFVFGAYQLGAGAPRMVNYQTALNDLKAPPFRRDGCLIVASPATFEGMAQTVIDRIAEVYPGKERAVVSDLSGGHPVVVFHPKD